MIDDGTGWFVPAGFMTLTSEVVDGELRVLVQTRREPAGCPGCGAVARVKDRAHGDRSGPAGVGGAGGAAVA